MRINGVAWGYERDDHPTTTAPPHLTPPHPTPFHHPLLPLHPLLPWEEGVHPTHHPPTHPRPPPPTPCPDASLRRRTPPTTATTTWRRWRLVWDSTTPTTTCSWTRA